MINLRNTISKSLLAHEYKMYVSTRCDPARDNVFLSPPNIFPHAQTQERMDLAQAYFHRAEYMSETSYSFTHKARTGTNLTGIAPESQMVKRVSPCNVPQDNDSKLRRVHVEHESSIYTIQGPVGSLLHEKSGIIQHTGLDQANVFPF